MASSTIGPVTRRPRDQPAWEAAAGALNAARPRKVLFRVDRLAEGPRGSPKTMETRFFWYTLFEMRCAETYRNRTRLPGGMWALLRWKWKQGLDWLIGTVRERGPTRLMPKLTFGGSTEKAIRERWRISQDHAVSWQVRPGCKSGTEPWTRALTRHEGATQAFQRSWEQGDE